MIIAIMGFSITVLSLIVCIISTIKTIKISKNLIKNNIEFLKAMESIEAGLK